MRLEQFQYVAEIARCNSMSKASKKLFITQPSLSTAIQNLENELGFQVFKRSFQGVALTEKGEEFLKISNIIVQQLENVKALSSSASSSSKSINIAAVPAACNSLILDLIISLRQKSPGATINIQELRPCKILPALIAGTADICIGNYVPSTKESIFKLAACNDIHIESVFKDSMCVYLHRNHPLAHKKSIYLQELEQEKPIFFNDYVLMDSQDPTPPQDQSSQNYFSFTDQTSIKKAVSKGLGYAVLPWQSAMDDIYVTSGMIYAVPLRDSEPLLTTFLAYRNQVVLPLAEQNALELLRQQYKHLKELQKEESLRSGISSGEDDPSGTYKAHQLFY